MHMMSRRSILALSGGGAVAAAMGGCNEIFGYGSFNFLWTVTVKVGDELKSGSAVYQISFYDKVFPSGTGISQRGVSPVIDLGERGMLIPLYRPDLTRMPNHGYGHPDVLSPLVLVRFTYLKDVEGWRGGRKCLPDQAITCTLSALRNATRVDAPDDLKPLFAFAPIGSQTMDDVKAYYADDLPSLLGREVSYIGTTIEPTWYWDTKHQFTADWFGKSRPSSTLIYASQDTVGRVVDADFGGSF